MFWRTIFPEMPKYNINLVQYVLINMVLNRLHSAKPLLDAPQFNSRFAGLFNGWSFATTIIFNINLIFLFRYLYFQFLGKMAKADLGLLVNRVSFVAAVAT